ncbi:trypsin-like peptidase domain-containing protein [Methylocapsa polymorpha]|uniref:Trypsin-like peptidase domain-containing protein n=1 Tax=Methylocapsa polymorpha TaxID=3080828 RepID=A0ABZ0HR70_9HYPH|nr:trypsin-like peptidase domain-containing protein [Methylocapsa sp. RX1]
MTNRFLQIAIIWLLVLATGFVAEPYLVAWRFSATSPQTIAPRADLTETERTTIKLFQTVSPSVVYIFAQTSSQNLFTLEPEESVVQTGTGIIWDPAGHVITNYHVAKGSNQFGARLPSGESVAARIIAVSPQYDLAVLQLERPRAPIHPIAIGNSSDLQVGQSAFAIGNPYGLEQTLTSGIISALHRRIPTESGHEIVGGIQTDAPLNPGNSGGPLLDSSGRLIGVNSAIISGSGSSSGIGIAIPIDVVNRVAAELIREGHVPIPGIGIVAAAEAAATRLGIDGVVILRVQPDSPAAKAGLEGVAPGKAKVGDVITAVNGQTVHDITDLAGVFEQIGVGKTVTLTVLCGDQSRSVEVTLADVSRYQG